MVEDIRSREILVVSGLVGLWFCFQTNWGTFPDPDAYYHAHLAARIVEHGPVRAFPWLDLTTLGQHPVDSHYLYHRILGPAIMLFGSFPGTQIMAVVLGTLSMAMLWLVLRNVGPPRQGLIPASMLLGAVLLTPYFTLRMESPKASALSVGCFIVTIGAVVLRRSFIVGVAGLVFALAHGGWIISIGAAGLIVAGDILMSRAVGGSWGKAVVNAPWKPLGCLLLGISVGILLHPNRSELLHFLWVQIVEAGIKKSSEVSRAVEWSPMSLRLFGMTLLPLAVAVGIWISAFFYARRHGSRWRAAPESGRQRPSAPRAGVLLALPALAALLLTLRSRRFLEYLIPSLALWIASLWALLDLDPVLGRLRAGVRSLERWQRWGLLMSLGIVAVVLVAAQVYEVRERINPFRYPWDVYRSTMGAISERAGPGDRVFNAGWDDFPILFALDDRLRYVWGLDPTFLFDANPELGQQVSDLASGRRQDAWDVIRLGTQSRFVFVRTTQFPRLDAVLQSDARFREVARDPWSAAYELIDGTDP